MAPCARQLLLGSAKRSHFRAALYTCLLVSALFAAAPASADLYRWLDQDGKTVISNVPPLDRRQVTQFEVMLKEPKVTSTEQALRERIDGLERQLRTRQMTERAAAPAPSYQGYYAPPAAPAYSSSDYYSTYPWPYYYSYPAVIRIAPRRTVFGPHAGFARIRSAHRGRR